MIVTTSLLHFVVYLNSYLCLSQKFDFFHSCRVFGNLVKISRPYVSEKYCYVYVNIKGEYSAFEGGIGSKI